MPYDILSRVRYLSATNETESQPLSADVYAVRGDTAWWIFDVGASDEAAAFVNSLDDGLQKNIVISHFHMDHAANISRVHYDKLFVGRETLRHTKTGTVVMEPMEFDDGVRIRIAPIPNSHAKGSLLLGVNEYVFLGDSTYPSVGHGRPDFYNVQILYSQINFLKELDASYFLMSRRRFIPREKSSIVQFLEGVYAQRKPKENEIEVNE